MGSKLLPTRFSFAAISCFQINSLFSLFTPIKPIRHPFAFIFSSSLHTSTNQPRLQRQDLSYAFECITSTGEALPLFHYMLQMKPTLRVHYYNKLLHSVVKIESDSEVVKMDHYSQVIFMFKELWRLGCPVNEYTMNIVINCHAHLKEVHMSFAVIGAFLKRGYAPNIVTFTCLIKGLFIKGKVVEAFNLFKILIKGNNLCKVNEYTISIVLNGLSKSGYVDAALELLQIAEKNDDWRLNHYGYNAVIDGLCKGGMLKDGMELLFRMVDRGILPNVVTYTCLMHALCMNGKLEFACNIFNDLPSKGICPNVITYNVIIQGFCKEALFRDAKEVLEKMERVGCFPNHVTYNIVIRGCLHHLGNFDSINLLEQIVGADFQLRASTFFLLLGKMQILRQMHGIYDDDVINHLIRKLISNSAAIHQMRDKDGAFMISSLIAKLNSVDT